MSHISLIVILLISFVLCEERGLRMGERMRRRFRRPKQVCYGEVGCFGGGRKAPQSPEEVGTSFVLEKGLPPLPGHKLCIIIHGFKGTAHDPGATALSLALRDQGRCRVVLVDWARGARGPSYLTSAANTQLVGRQVANYVQELIESGVSREDVHLIGFSLGAHIAGYAGRALTALGLPVARITGLDPASPLFREQLRMSLSSLTRSDAEFVDILHTDGALLWPSGFGLLKALGHADYFPNGGQDQPGCSHIRASVIVSHFEGTVNSSAVCNHVRAFQLFLESSSLESDCRFRAFPCQSREHFASGACFPSSPCHPNATDGSCGEMGQRAAESLARGPLYLVTRESSPFCGEQVQAVVDLAGRPGVGQLRLLLTTETDSTSFSLRVGEGGLARGLGALKSGSLGRSLSARMLRQRQTAAGLYIETDPPPALSIVVSDLDANRWSFCSVDGTEGPHYQLEKGDCTSRV